MNETKGHEPVEVNVNEIRPKWGRSTLRTCKRCGHTAPAHTFPMDRSGHRKHLCQPCVDAYFDPDRQRAHRLAHAQAYRRRAAQHAGKTYRTLDEMRTQAATRAAAQRHAREAYALHDAHVREFNSDKARVWRWRYRHDQAFREKQLERIRSRKARMAYPKLGDLMRGALKRDGDSPTVEAITGWSIAELRSHLEQHFTVDMTWQAFNAGRIHIDHVVPASCFNLASLRGVRAAWALSNLRPVWAEQNLRRKLGPQSIRVTGPFSGGVRGSNGRREERVVSEDALGG